MIMFKSVSQASPYTLKTEFVLNEGVTDLRFKVNISSIIYISVSYILPQFQSRSRKINIADLTYFGICLWCQNKQRKRNLKVAEQHLHNFLIQ